MRSRAGWLLLLGVAVAVGCSNSPTDQMTKDYDQRTKRTEEITALLATVRDQPTFEAAKPKLDAMFVQMREDLRAHARVPEFLEVIGDARDRRLVALGGEEFADLVGHID